MKKLLVIVALGTVFAAPAFAQQTPIRGDVQCRTRLSMSTRWTITKRGTKARASIRIDNWAATGPRPIGDTAGKISHPCVMKASAPKHLGGWGRRAGMSRVSRPIRPDIGADGPAFRADHLRPEWMAGNRWQPTTAHVQIGTQGWDRTTAP